MYLSEITIDGYKLFGEKFIAEFNPGLSVIVGENGSGKSAIIDAIRLLLNEDEYGRLGISTSDFYRPLDKNAKATGSGEMRIKGRFCDLTDIEQVCYLTWMNPENLTQALLNLSIENKQDSKGRYNRNIWGGKLSSGVFEWNLLNAIHCIYLPPLRDALDKLESYKGSRLARLIKNLSPVIPEGEQHPLEKAFKEFNEDLLKDKTIKQVDETIKKNIIDSVGTIFGQDAMVQFAEVNFNRIIERLRLLFYPKVPAEGETHENDMFRDLKENSLGYNNILYFATVLAELEGLKDDDTLHKMLLIEEPEAHLHPQLLSKLLHFISEKANESGIQVIVTTHSAIVASSVGIDNIKVMSIPKLGNNPNYISLSESGFTADNKFFLSRWLDVTKSTLLFAKSVLFVEGIAELLIIPELAKVHFAHLIKEGRLQLNLKTIEDFGISVICIGGIYFDSFMQLFSGYTIKKEGECSKCSKIDVRCAGITDNDPEKEATPTIKNPEKGRNRCLFMLEQLEQNSSNARLFSNLKTLEYDLALCEGNLNPMLTLLLGMINTDGAIKKQVEESLKKDWGKELDEDKAPVAKFLLDKIESGSFTTKGGYAQFLAKNMHDGKIDLAVPLYIQDALNWLIEPRIIKHEDAPRPKAK